MKTRIYVIDIDNYEFDTPPIKWNDGKFMSEAEIQGGVYSLEGFEEAFNSGYINSETYFIRIIGVPYDTSNDDLYNEKFR